MTHKTTAVGNSVHYVDEADTRRHILDETGECWCRPYVGCTDGGGEPDKRRVIVVHDGPGAEPN